MKVLDCTLRDGGYINDWLFSDKEITTVLNALEDSKIDIVECGYLNTKKGQSNNSTLFTNLETIDRHLQFIDNKSKKVVMINLGDYEIKDLKDKSTTVIDGIRLAFHKKDLDKALKQGKEIIDLGYELYFQPMVTKNYKDIEFLSMIQEVNILNPYAFYVVDSFGSMTLEEFNSYLVLSNNNLNQNIVLGYHSHNNMQLAFSNAVSMCMSNMKRETIVDASIYGIGRGAGNLNTELIADYLNNTFNKQYNILPLLEIMDEFLSLLMKKNPWGFSPAQYLSASFNCHPNYATYLINKNTKHIVGVRKVLEKLPADKKSSFDEKFIEDLYISSLLESKTPICDEIVIDKSKTIVLLASGPSIKEYDTVLKEKENDKEFILIALNHNPKYICDYYFFSNQKRLNEFGLSVPLEKILITNNLTSQLAIVNVLDLEKLVYVEDKLVTNVAMVAINYLISKEVEKVELAGLDGYRIDMNNYSYKENMVITDSSELMEQNRMIEESLKVLAEKIEIEFLTPSIFT